MPRGLPVGTVTFLFTDVEGSTKLLHELGAERYAEALAEHRGVLREAFAAHGGVEVDRQGDAFFVAFPTAPGALEAAAAVLEGLAGGPIRVRVGLHTGTPLLGEEGYVGVDVHRAARIAAAGCGGQVLVSASTAALLGADGLRDLGEHRLKDLSAAERIYQVGDDDFPPLKSLYRTNLPVTATPFLGRERELAEVLGLLAEENVRLLTLTGPGGTGKTRLGLQAAAEASERYPDGIFWVPLAPLRDPELVLETAGQALGAKDGLAEHVADKSTLVLFDNFEQVVEAAGGVSELLAACPNLQLLVTSREPLHVSGEQEYPVRPLAHEEGIRFFLARARAVRPDFEADAAVSEICRRLDDLPLALELAAARLKALSPGQILERLDERLPLLTGGARDLPERQRTLRRTIEWSYELLTPEEQHLFARLAVFRGGCALEAAEVVAGADLDTLQSLVDKSLLRHSEERFWMLETMREFASERLEQLSEAERLCRRHADRFVALAEEAEPYLFGLDESGEWIERLERDRDNLRAALDHLQASGETELALGLAGALWVFWRDRGHFAEGRRRLEGVLDADERPTAARAKALKAAASMASLGGDGAMGRQRGEEALSLYRDLGDVRGIAESESWIGWALGMEGSWGRARQHFEESVRRFRELGDENSTVTATHMLAWAHDELGARDRAKALDEDNLSRARELRNEQIEATVLDKLASYALHEGRVEDGLLLAAESLRIYRDLGDSMGVAVELCRCACALALNGRTRTAARLLSWSDAQLEREIGGTMPWLARIKEETLTIIRGELDEAAFAKEWAQGRKLTADEAVALAHDSGERAGRGPTVESRSPGV